MSKKVLLIFSCRNLGLTFRLGFFFFLRFLFIYLTETAREGTQAGGGGEGEAGFLLSREPNSGLNPRILGFWPELKADRHLMTVPPWDHDPSQNWESDIEVIKLSRRPIKPWWHGKTRLNPVSPQLFLPVGTFPFVPRQNISLCCSPRRTYKCCCCFFLPSHFLKNFIYLF